MTREERQEVARQKREMIERGENIITFRGGMARKITREAERRGVSPVEALLQILTEELAKKDERGEL